MYQADSVNDSLYETAIMAVKTLCLGLLSNGEACGYELKKTFESLFKHFFPAGYGSIYPALADLAANDLVECREIPQTGKPDRKVYSITEKGRAAFEKALRNTQPRHKLRSDFLAMMYFADLLDESRVSSLLDDRIEAFEDAVEHIASIQVEMGKNASAGAKFVAGFGAVIAKAAAEYIETNRHLLIEANSGDMLGNGIRGQLHSAQGRT
jgi:PadR family transcriptional regulator, regulatory protein AphA